MHILWCKYESFCRRDATLIKSSKTIIWTLRVCAAFNLNLQSVLRTQIKNLAFIWFKNSKFLKIVSLFCRTYKCLRQSDTLDLDKLSDFKCFDDNDCANDLSGMVCTNYSHLQSSVKYCNCPPGYAYNTNDCKCEPAELCWSSTVRLKWRFHEKIAHKCITFALFRF